MAITQFKRSMEVLTIFVKVLTNYVNTRYNVAIGSLKTAAASKPQDSRVVDSRAPHQNQRF